MVGLVALNFYTDPIVIPAIPVIPEPYRVHPRNPAERELLRAPSPMEDAMILLFGLVWRRRAE